MFQWVMGIWFLICIALLFVTGTGNLYFFYKSVGVPSLVTQVLHPAVLFALLLVATSFALVARKSWARSSALALAWWILVSAFAALALAYAPGTPAFFRHLNLFNLITPEFASAVLPLQGSAVGGSLLAFIFAAYTLRVFYSNACNVTFNATLPVLWKTFAFFLIPAILLVGVSQSLGFPSLADTKPKGNKRAAGKNDAAVAGQQPPTEEARRKAEQTLAGKGVRFCRISLDESRLLLITSDGRGHLVDLRTGSFTSHDGKIDPREWPASFSDSQISPIGPDADMYFDSDRSMILRFTDPKFRFAISSGTQQFVGFTSSPNQIIVYHRESQTLRRIQIPIGTVIWEARLTPSFKMSRVKAYGSPDFTRLVLAAPGGQMVVVHTREGRLYNFSVSMDELRTVQFGAKQIRFSGPAGGVETHWLYDSATGGARKQDEFGTQELSLYDEGRGLMLGKTAPAQLTGPGQAVSGPALNGNVLHAAVLNPDRFLAAVEEGQSQLTLIDLDAGTMAGVGKFHELFFNKDQTCFAISSTHRVFALSSGDQTEIFWSAYLVPGQFRSVRLSLPIK